MSDATTLETVATSGTADSVTLHELMDQIDTALHLIQRYDEEIKDSQAETRALIRDLKAKIVC